MKLTRKNDPGFLRRKMNAVKCFIDTHRFRKVSGTSSVYRCARCFGVFISRDGVDFKPIKKIGR